MCSRCSPIPQAASTWAMCATTPWATCSLATSAPRASTCCIRWAGMRSGCRPRTRPWSARSIPRHGPTTTSPPCARSSSPWVCRSTGRASSPPATSPTTTSSRSSSSTSIGKVSLIAGWARSTGIPSTRPCLPTSRSSTAAAGARARSSKTARCPSGISGSPSMPTSYWTRSAI